MRQYEIGLMVHSAMIQGRGVLQRSRRHGCCGGGSCPAACSSCILSSAQKQVATEGSSMSPLRIRRRSSGSGTRTTCAGE